MNLSFSPCLTRVKALEAAGVLQRHVALAKTKALGLGLGVFISISLKKQSTAALAAFEARIAEHDEHLTSPAWPWPTWPRWSASYWSSSRRLRES